MPGLPEQNLDEARARLSAASNRRNALAMQLADCVAVGTATDALVPRYREAVAELHLAMEAEDRAQLANDPSRDPSDMSMEELGRTATDLALPYELRRRALTEHRYRSHRCRCCGHPMKGSDHCPSCGCEEFEERKDCCARWPQ